MSNTPHTLHADFPDMADQITRMKSTDAHFARLIEEYHDINRAVHGAETNLTPVSVEAEIDMRKTRARLKDQIYGMLTG